MITTAAANFQRKQTGTDARVQGSSFISCARAGVSPCKPSSNIRHIAPGEGLNQGAWQQRPQVIFTTAATAITTGAAATTSAAATTTSASSDAATSVTVTNATTSYSRKAAHYRTELTSLISYLPANIPIYCTRTHTRTHDRKRHTHTQGRGGEGGNVREFIRSLLHLPLLHVSRDSNRYLVRESCNYYSAAAAAGLFAGYFVVCTKNVTPTSSSSSAGLFFGISVCFTQTTSSLLSFCQ